MKQSFLVVFCIFLLSACSAYNRIDTNNQNDLKTMRLAQSLMGNFAKAKMDSTKSSAFKADAVYLYKEQTGQRPIVTLDLKNEKLKYELTDSSVFITLDGENIPLPFLQGQSIIAENLWVPILYSKNIQYKLNFNSHILVLTLNEKQMNQLIDFFHKAIKYRDDIFPAVPPGQKKW
jgi:hypothetical protein